MPLSHLRPCRFIEHINIFVSCNIPKKLLEKVPPKDHQISRLFGAGAVKLEFCLTRLSMEFGVWWERQKKLSLQMPNIVLYYSLKVIVRVILFAMTSNNEGEPMRKRAFPACAKAETPYSVYLKCRIKIFKVWGCSLVSFGGMNGVTRKKILVMHMIKTVKHSPFSQRKPLNVIEHVKIFPINPN